MLRASGGTDAATKAAVFAAEEAKFAPWTSGAAAEPPLPSGRGALKLAVVAVLRCNL